MFTKVDYIEGVTLIPAQNLNDIQDGIIQNESDIGDLQTDVSGLQTDVGALQSHAVFNAPATDGTYVLKVTVSDGTATYEWVEEVPDEPVEPDDPEEVADESGN